MNVSHTYVGVHKGQRWRLDTLELGSRDQLRVPRTKLRAFSGE